VDPSTLADLPGSHLRAGLAEAVKFGAVLDPHFLDELETWGGLAAEGDPDALDRVVSRALELKCRAVLDDPGATGTQEFLHFGHTLAGAIEVTESEGGSLHGEAVAQGMMFALRLGRELGVTSEAAALRLVSVLAGLGLGQDALDIHPTILQRAMIHDKKVRDGRHWYVLLEELGSPVTRSSVEPDLVARVLRAFVTDHSRKLAVCN